MLRHLRRHAQGRDRRCRGIRIAAAAVYECPPTPLRGFGTLPSRVLGSSLACQPKLSDVSGERRLYSPHRATPRQPSPSLGVAPKLEELVLAHLIMSET